MVSAMGENRGQAAGWWAIAAMVVLLTQCAPTRPKLNPADAARMERANETFGYRRWQVAGSDPDVVIIALHGFCGASIDYDTLGRYMMEHQPKTAVYAYEVRGQGSDPKRSRRGDIDDPNDWYRDLETFTRLIRKRHPKAKVVWFGESMGALITAHTWYKDPGRKPCDAMVLSSPVVHVRNDVPVWKKQLLFYAAEVIPRQRLSLNALSGGQDVQMTATSKHNEQTKVNPWHVESHTLRLLATLGRHIDNMNQCVSTVNVPLLVLHGGRDFFTSKQDVDNFVQHVPKKTSFTRREYPKSYHLLMYDEQKLKVMRDIAKWTEKLRRDRL